MILNNLIQGNKFGCIDTCDIIPRNASHGIIQFTIQHRLLAFGVVLKIIVVGGGGKGAIGKSSLSKHFFSFGPVPR
jgi:hypothetical protein